MVHVAVAPPKTAIFDERLTGRFKTDVPVAEPREALEISCKLIYLFHLATERRERP